MSDITAAESGHDTGESFEALFQESIDKAEKNEGSVVEGIVIAIDNDMAVIDVGLKSEGRVPLKEFSAPGDEQTLSVGDKVEVFLDRIENRPTKLYPNQKLLSVPLVLRDSIDNK